MLTKSNHLKKNNKKQLNLMIQYFMNKQGIHIMKNIDNIDHKYFTMQGDRYLKNENYDKALDFYSYACNRGSNTAMKKMVNIFDHIGDFDNSDEYHLKYIDNQLEKYSKTSEYYNTIVPEFYQGLFYNYLKRKSIKAYEFYTSKQKIFTKFDEDIQYSFMKLLPKFKELASFMNKKDDCSICYSNKKLYVYYCGEHYFCNECYMKIESCALCRFKINYNDNNNDAHHEHNYDNDDDDNNDFHENSLIYLLAYIIRERDNQIPSGSIRITELT